MAKTYPVRLFYFYNRQGQKIWHTDKYKATYEAGQHAQLYKIAVLEVYEINIPRTLNSEIAIQLITGRFNSFPFKLHARVHYRKTHNAERPEKALDPYDLLGLDRTTVTKESLRAAFKKAAMKYHPDQGGSTEAMQAVNAAHATIKKQGGW